MGFKKNYEALQEIFPEVDSRLLRAVAIEHAKDADSAVEAVLTEVMPYLTGMSLFDSSSELWSAPQTSSGENWSAEQTPNSSSENRAAGKTPSSSSESRAAEPTPGSSIKRRAAEQTPGSSSESRDVVQSPKGASGTTCTDNGHLQTPICPDEDLYGQFYDAESDHDQLFHGVNGGLHQICGDRSIGKLTSIVESVMNVCASASSPVPSAVLIHGNGANTSHDICGSPKTEDVIVKSGNYGESSIEVVSNQHAQIISSALEHQNSALDQCIANLLQVESITGENPQEKYYAAGEVVAVKDSLGHIIQSSLGSSEMSSAEFGTSSVDMPLILNSDAMKQANDSENDASKIESPDESADVMDESNLSTGVTLAAQTCSVDLLEDLLVDARNNKKTLFTAMESVINLMKEVELQEKSVEQAKEEAVEGGLEIFKRLEELKQILQHAKEANDMHAGEVYGEKAILATEVRELQSRLLSLSDERDKSLCILDEMRENLQVRLAAAEKEREAVEKEKLEKEEIGRKLLAEQEKVMEKVVQDANTLKREAEENAKLQEFLVDRGRVVDILQGEISVICQDVRLLKEKFDERLPLSKSLTSSQTSCILASSSSSLKSMGPDQAEQVTETAEKKDLVPSFIQPESSGAEAGAYERKALIDDGWEIFDNGYL